MTAFHPCADGIPRRWRLVLSWSEHSLLGEKQPSTNIRSFSKVPECYGIFSKGGEAHMPCACTSFSKTPYRSFDRSFDQSFGSNTPGIRPRFRAIPGNFVDLPVLIDWWCRRHLLRRHEVHILSHVMYESNGFSEVNPRTNPST